ncbi:non-specific lipid-transfer protein 3-like [Neltuma alba]|uniref:non-specific lipid-transfer protein 3-like n=1 Tax=Neltuma alba TaxID=207710 RepID=UPI0010A42DCE|nr:non-specific lipid-transfer protein 3-like [Prosopis alba]XP_028791071.1 non-specific lipid-transfer protein 3-like [Prosopis alba]
MAGASSTFQVMAAIMVAIVVVISSSEAQDHVSPKAAVPCKRLTLAITPCRRYLMGSEAKPSRLCCHGVKNINEELQSKEDRIDACKCMKQALSLVGTYDPNRIPMIPKHCGYSFALPAIRKNTDCSRAVEGGF